jgi:hypothetical protein
MTVHETIAEFGIAMATNIVNGINAIFKLEDGNVMTLGCDSNTCAFKQLGL